METVATDNIPRNIAAEKNEEFTAQGGQWVVCRDFFTILEHEWKIKSYI